MSVQSEINRIKGNVTAALAKIAEKGVTVPDGANSDNLEALIEAISAGGGGYEVTCGIITPAEDTESLSFAHGLSKAPSFVHIFLPAGYSVTTYANTLRTMYYRFGAGSSVNEKFDSYTSRGSTSYYYHENSLLASDDDFIVDDSTVIAPACSFHSATAQVRKWLSGKPYLWICIGGYLLHLPLII